MLKIDNKTARNFWLSSNGLGRAPIGPLNTMAIIKELGFVQLDTIQVVSRAHHHILWSRNQNYREHMLDELLGETREIFEHFTHDASVIPVEFLPMWKKQFARKKAQMSKPNWFKNLPDKAGRNEIKQRIANEGPLSTKAFNTKATGNKKVWARPPHKQALDFMWYTGELATSHRVNFNKFYDIAENIFPAELWQQDQTDQTQTDWLCWAAMDRLGLATLREVQEFWEAISTQDAKGWLTRAMPELQTIQVQSADGSWTQSYASKDIENQIASLMPTTSRLRILNPFDPAIRNRKRLERLFGFEYRVEMFVPEAKRIWGYYVYPLLEGDRFIGRIEVKADRKNACLRVLNIWLENGQKWPPAKAEKLNAELSRLSKLAECLTVNWDCKMPN